MTARYKLRTEALLTGQRYFEATPCKRCAGVMFYASNGNCMTCPPRSAESFLEWSLGQQLTDRELEVAELAWRAAKGRTPMPMDDALRVVRTSPAPITTVDIAGALGISRRHIGIQLRRMRAMGLVTSAPAPRKQLTWRPA